MRADPREYELVVPNSLGAVAALLANEPGQWTPIAGGTDVMVLYAAGKLTARKLVSVWNLQELRRIEVTPEEVRIGAGCTYSDLQKHEAVLREFPMLASAASWTGGVANQNRGTLGGNIVNASPAADSLPALLAYEAKLALFSVRGERRVPYTEFHFGYKKHALSPDELIRNICLPRNTAGYISYCRKVGARNAQAIAKVCIAALGKMRNGVIEDVRIGMGSVAPVPLRLRETERALLGKKAEPELVEEARRTVAQQIQPIDDIRSTARYREAVAANLVAEFVEKLCVETGRQMDEVLARWNELEPVEAVKEILPCCGSNAWAEGMVSKRPFDDEAAVLITADEAWRKLGPPDWLEAFKAHPKIGESRAAEPTGEPSATWSDQEQKSVAAAQDDVKLRLAEGNRAYEQKFGFIFIVCATGKSAPEILEILERRLQNVKETELKEAAEEQRQITQLRLKKWLGI